MTQPTPRPWDYYRENVFTVTDDCKIWPYSVDTAGYGQLHLNPPSYRVHILACTGWNGPKPFPTAEAAHGPCHNRRCWNGAHLSWKTHAENMADQLRDGTLMWGERHRSARLTAEQVQDMREAVSSGRLTQKEICNLYNLTSGHVSLIINRQRWKHL